MNEASTTQILTGSIERPCVIRGAYYKHMLGADGSPIHFMSGLPLPLDSNGRLDGVTFDGCEFHPCCPDVVKLGGTLVNCWQ